MAICYPLDYVRSNVEEFVDWDVVIEGMLGRIIPRFRLNKEEFCNYVLGVSYENPSFVPNQYNTLRNKLIKRVDVLQNIFGMNCAGMTESQIATEWRDLLAFTIVNVEWQKNKQIYHLDPEFSRVLFETEEANLHLSLIQKLQYKNFYVDFSDCNLFAPFVGCFTNIVERGTYLTVSIFLLTEKGTTYSMYVSYKADAKGFYHVDRSSFTDKDFITLEEKCKDESVKANNSKVTYSKMAVLVIQVVMYLTSANPDIAENEITKHTYRKSNVIKNKFSEIQQWDVGFAFGNSLRNFYDQEENECYFKNHSSKLKKSVKKIDAFPVTSNSNHEPDSEKIAKRTVTNQSNGRRTVEPHIRAAHWHHYWVGEGRTELIVKWLPPTFVNSNGAVWDIPESKFGDTKK